MTPHNITQGQFLKTPKIGDTKTMHIFGKIQMVVILAVRPAGTLDIELTNGDCYRVSGFAFI